MNKTGQYVIAASFTANGMDSFYGIGILLQKKTKKKKMLIKKRRLRFCFAWPKFGKVYFRIFLFHTFHQLHSHSQERKDPVFTCSSCTCFTASSTKHCKTNCTFNKTGEKLKNGTYIYISWSTWIICTSQSYSLTVYRSTYNLESMHQVHAVVLSGLALALTSIALQLQRM